MSSRRWGVGVAAVVAAVLVIGAAGVLLFRPIRGPLVEHRCPAGGFTLTLPASWRVHLRESASTPWNWIEADRRTRLGPSDAWLWLNRTQPGGPNPLATARRNALDDIRRHWGDVHVTTRRTTFDGHTALSLRSSHPYLEHLGFMPGADVDEVRLITEQAGQVYELGVVGWPGLPREAHDLEHLLQLSAPRGVRTINDEEIGLHIALPAAWNRDQSPRSDMPGAVLTATDPSNPPSGWTVLWEYDEPVETAVAQSASKAAREGTIVARFRTMVGGVPATRIDFQRRTPSADDTYYFSTWIFQGRDGKAWQLLVGSTIDDTATAIQIASSVTLLDERPDASDARLMGCSAPPLGGATD